MTKPGITIKAVLFDFDGTLTEPGALDFTGIKKAIGCPLDQPILEFIDSLSESTAQKKMMAVLDDFEMKGANSSDPNPDTEAIISYLQAKEIKVGVITRNGLKPVLRALENFPDLDASNFDIIISRDDPVEPKPSGDGVIQAARRMKVDPAEMLVVGDYIFDIQAGQNAGAATALLTTSKFSEEWADSADYRIESLLDIKKIISFGLPLAPGKLPNHMLESFLSDFDKIDPALIVPPGVGEDTAAIDVNGEEVIVLKSDPITFVSTAAGFYSVIINANDILTSGATPRWFLTSILFPVGIMPSEAMETLAGLKKVCEEEKITLCGGHTEITDAVNRTIITGMMVGTVPKKRLIDKQSMRKGHLILLTKAVTVEGTAIIATEFKDRLQLLGMPIAEINRCRQFSKWISIREEATIAGSIKGVTAMHDVTEGGLASALFELSCAGGHRLSIQKDLIPIYPETEHICSLLDIDPLGLIGSGSLLICCTPESAESLIEAIRNSGTEVRQIGEVAEKGRGIDARQDGAAVDWPSFEVDEITRLTTS